MSAGTYTLTLTEDQYALVTKPLQAMVAAAETFWEDCDRDEYDNPQDAGDEYDALESQADIAREILAQFA
ncbi:hypothetical protein [Microbacterium aurantiacum]|uniref:Uncharacterized protein n=1 Tax=Microbacterium aurantiacum TaxID=162393 RepID=A0A0M8MCQ5_9MICO|nr:hypothetical protein [Microbacterium chocolatum]ANG86365.1 hypothetical protein A8L33_14265 [Microbacterium chocolatum]KOS09696.1 hypothetical protein XI38_14505 [Microbacterium chocolatum]